MDYEPFKVEYTAGQPYVGATLSMYPPKGESQHGQLHCVGCFQGQDRLVEQGAVLGLVGCSHHRWRHRLLGTLEGYFKCVDQKDGKELYKFRTPSGIIGNVFTYGHKGKQYIGVFSGVGGWAGIGLAAGLTNPTDGLGAVGGYAGLNNYTALGGSLTVWTLP